MSPPKVNIVVPMAGRGSRFANEGFLKPKPVIDVAGKPMITWVLDNVDSELIEATYVMLILKEQQDKYDLISQLRGLKSRMEFVLVDQVTEGAACTALLAREFITNDDPLFIVNSDQFVEWDADAYWKDRITGNENQVDGDILCFHVPMSENDIKWSYAKLNEEGFVTMVREKEVISENATVGMYYWRRGNDYVESADKMIEADARIKGEFYVAPVYNFGFDLFQRKYTVSFCKKMWGLGVPKDLVSFLSDYVRPRHIKKLGHDSQPIGPEHHSRSSGPLRFIAHRGNLDGRNPGRENEPGYIAEALSQGFDVEVDAWLDESTGSWSLGHDEPQYPVDYEFLLNDHFWVHAKNGPALRVLSADNRVHCFTHDRDEYTLTSNGLIWAYPDQPLLGPRCIAVMYSNPHKLLTENIYGICQDNVGQLRDEYVALRNSVCLAPGSKRRIRLVVFDLDGVLVESRDLHYEALNQALLEVAGEEYVISREEHEFIYNGLSTNQKLRMLERSKGLRAMLHHGVWSRKQELTEKLVHKILKPTDGISHCLTSLKRAGFPIAVASNCIRSSVNSILKVIGVLEQVDVFFSSEDCTHPKPDPDIYTDTCAAFCVDPSEALVVEDSQKGWEAASRAGCNLFRVSCPADVTLKALLTRVREVETLTETVTVVVPLAGPYRPAWIRDTPKEMPLFVVDAAGRPVISWIMESLLSRRYMLNYVFITKQDVCNTFSLESICAAAIDYQPFRVVQLKHDTLGSADSVMHCPSELLPPDRPLLIADGHSVPQWMPGQSLDSLLSTSADGAVSVVASTDQRWSYVRMAPDSQPPIAQIHMEREPASNLACSGLYYFRRAGDFVEAAQKLIERQERSRGWYYSAPTLNHLIAQGKEVQSFQLQEVWSLRTMAEVAEFERFYVPTVADAKLNEIYRKMKKRQAKAVAAKGLSYDADLLRDDPRRCLAIYTLCEDKNFSRSRPLQEFQAKLDELLGEKTHCLYLPLLEKQCENPLVTSATLHWTFMQMITFQVYGKVEVPEGFKEVVEAVLRRHLRSFKVYFSNVIVTPSSVLVAGYPSADVNTARAELRRVLKRCGLPLFEPYLNDIVHMTVARFASPISPGLQAEIQRAADQLGTYAPLGVMHIRELTLSPASWKMQPQELGMHEKHVIQLS